MDSYTYENDPVFLAAYTVIMLLFLIFYCVPLLVASVMLYRKAGRTAADAIIPIWSTFVLAKIARRPMLYAWALSVLTVVSFIPSLPVWTMTLVTVSSVILTIYVLIGFARQYDKRAGYWVLFVLVPAVAVFMTRKAKYIGPKD